MGLTITPPTAKEVEENNQKADRHCKDGTFPKDDFFCGPESQKLREQYLNEAKQREAAQNQKK